MFLPNQNEIDSLELYISKYLWGGMQMTDKEKYPYAIYGIPNFKANRASADEGRNGQAHVWRIYDYPHIVMLYYRMYQIAKFYPDKVKHLDAPTLSRARVSHRRRLLDGADRGREMVGRRRRDDERGVHPGADRRRSSAKARRSGRETLRGHWEGKVDRFVNRTPNLYGSEFAFDSTGFESTGAFAKYAWHLRETRRPASDDSARVTPEAAQKFMDFQLLAEHGGSRLARDDLLPARERLPRHLTYLLSYMSQMGGWSILDYGLHFAADPDRLPAARLRLVAQLVGAGELRHRGERLRLLVPERRTTTAPTGGGFMPEPMGRAWIGKQMTRGAWYYSAEEDVGYCRRAAHARDHRHARPGASARSPTAAC